MPCCCKVVNSRTNIKIFDVGQGMLPSVVHISFSFIVLYDSQDLIQVTAYVVPLYSTYYLPGLLAVQLALNWEASKEPLPYHHSLQASLHWGVQGHHQELKPLIIVWGNLRTLFCYFKTAGTKYVRNQSVNIAELN